MPDTRVGSIFKDSVCLACRNYETRKEIDWAERQKMLKEICKKRIAENGEYDCIDGRQRINAILSYLGENDIDEDDNAFHLKIENEIYDDEGRFANVI